MAIFSQWSHLRCLLVSLQFETCWWLVIESLNQWHLAAAAKSNHLVCLFGELQIAEFWVNSWSAWTQSSCPGIFFCIGDNHALKSLSTKYRQSLLPEMTCYCFFHHAESLCVPPSFLGLDMKTDKFLREIVRWLNYGYSLIWCFF